MPQLPQARRLLSQSIVVLMLSLALACERHPPVPGKKDTVAAPTPPPESTVVTSVKPSGWDSTAGPALFIVGGAANEAFVIVPRYSDTAGLDSAQSELTRIRSIQVDLFGAGKRIGGARVGSTVASTRTDSCRTWPTAHLDVTSGDTAAARGWNVGFEAGRAVVVPLDSIEELATADSARFAADIARIASALPDDTSATFRGLPFVVNKAWRVRLPGGPDVLIAVVVRNVNQEANPRQERILLIAERDSSAPQARFTPQYWERAAGPEETLETTDPIAVVLLGIDRRPSLIITRDSGNGMSYSFIERVAGRWQRLWASAYAGC
jgi:hypothetical protein